MPIPLTVLTSSTIPSPLATSIVVKLGQITELVNDYIGFNYTAQGVGLVTVQNAFSTSAQMFISFKKDCSANISSLLGYYAEATFVNNDYQNHNELFGVNSQVAISSK